MAAPIAASSLFFDPAPTAQVEDDITFTLEGDVVTVTGAQGKSLLVVSLTGRLLASYRITSPSQRVELNLSKGCYILKVGKVVRKVSIQ
jgi:hypothetical protein